jgi:transcriptional regulator with XRE-family HTH domain
MSPITLRIRELRQAREMTQAQLAERAGVREATISELETGKSRRLLDVLEKIARALNVAPGELLGPPIPKRRPPGRSRAGGRRE